MPKGLNSGDNIQNQSTLSQEIVSLCLRCLLYPLFNTPSTERGLSVLLNHLLLLQKSQARVFLHQCHHVSSYKVPCLLVDPISYLLLLNNIVLGERDIFMKCYQLNSGTKIEQWQSICSSEDSAEEEPRAEQAMAAWQLELSHQQSSSLHHLYPLRT